MRSDLKKTVKKIKKADAERSDEIGQSRGVGETKKKKNCESEPGRRLNAELGPGQIKSEMEKIQRRATRAGAPSPGRIKERAAFKDL